MPVAGMAEFLAGPVTATRVFRHPKAQPLDQRGHGDIHPFFAFVTRRAVVDVDTGLGLARWCNLLPCRT